MKRPTRGGTLVAKRAALSKETRVEHSPHSPLRHFGFTVPASGTFRAPLLSVKLIIFISLNVFGAIGWSLGEPYGVMTAFLLSGVGSVAGVYLGWRLARRLLE
jgi:hypothetical protein